MRFSGSLLRQERCVFVDRVDVAEEGIYNQTDEGVKVRSSPTFGIVFSLER